MEVEFGDINYWNQRYTEKTGNFDWFLNYHQLKDYITPFITPDSRILVVGCGNSRLSANLYDDGYRNVVSVDVSDVVIEQMHNMHADRPELEWICMDIRLLDLPSESFDFVIDKATFDSIMCGAQSFTKANMTLKEIWRVLKPGARFVSISCGPPDVRMPHFQGQLLNWNIEHHTIAKFGKTVHQDSPMTDFYHIYICTKHSGPVVPALHDDDDEDDEGFGSHRSTRLRAAVTIMDSVIDKLEKNLQREDASSLPSFGTEGCTAEFTSHQQQRVYAAMANFLSKLRVMLSRLPAAHCSKSLESEVEQLQEEEFFADDLLGDITHEQSEVDEDCKSAKSDSDDDCEHLASMTSRAEAMNNCEENSEQQAHTAASEDLREYVVDDTCTEVEDTVYSGEDGDVAQEEEEEEDEQDDLHEVRNGAHPQTMFTITRSRCRSFDSLAKDSDWNLGQHFCEEKPVPCQQIDLQHAAEENYCDDTDMRSAHEIRTTPTATSANAIVECERLRDRVTELESTTDKMHADFRWLVKMLSNADIREEENQREMNALQHENSVLFDELCQVNSNLTTVRESEESLKQQLSEKDTAISDLVSQKATVELKLQVERAERRNITAFVSQANWRMFEMQKEVDRLRELNSETLGLFSRAKTEVELYQAGIKDHLQRCEEAMIAKLRERDNVISVMCSQRNEERDRTAVEHKSLCDELAATKAKLSKAEELNKFMTNRTTWLLEQHTLYIERAETSSQKCKSLEKHCQKQARKIASLEEQVQRECQLADVQTYLLHVEKQKRVDDNARFQTVLQQTIEKYKRELSEKNAEMQAKAAVIAQRAVWSEDHFSVPTAVSKTTTASQDQEQKSGFVSLSEEEISMEDEFIGIDLVDAPPYDVSADLMIAVDEDGGGDDDEEWTMTD